jgi:hypothetical protein
LALTPCVSKVGLSYGLHIIEYESTLISPDFEENFLNSPYINNRFGPLVCFFAQPCESGWIGSHAAEDFVKRLEWGCKKTCKSPPIIRLLVETCSVNVNDLGPLFSQKMPFLPLATSMCHVSPHAENKIPISDHPAGAILYSKFNMCAIRQSDENPKPIKPSQIHKHRVLVPPSIP